MTTTFRLRPDEFNENFLEKLRALFRRGEVEVVVHEVSEDYPFDNPAQVEFLEEGIEHYENGGTMVQKSIEELRSSVR